MYVCIHIRIHVKAYTVDVYIYKNIYIYIIYII